MDYLETTPRSVKSDKLDDHFMNPQTAEQLRSILSQGRPLEAVALLRPLGSAAAADLFISLPFEQQQILFREAPVDFAATLVAHFPYYHSYVLLHSRPIQEVRAILDKVEPADRMRFLDELPEEVWQGLMDELAGSKIAGVSAKAPVSPKVAVAAIPYPIAAAEPILEIRGVEKSFQQPDGRNVQVIAPTDLSLEADTIIALLGASGSGKSTLLRILAGLTAPTAGRVLWHGKPLGQSHQNVAIVFQSFALFPWLTVLDNVEAPLLARGVPHPERHQRALKALDSVGLKGFETAYPKETLIKPSLSTARIDKVEPA